jgi:hypothetical protein
MPLILGFAVLIGGVLLLTSGITSASFADVLKGNARTTYDANQGVGIAAPAAATAAATTPTTGATAITPANAPAKVKAMLALANAVVGAPYNNGAGHSAAFSASIAQILKMGTDCSGFVSLLLGPRGAGVLTGPLTTQGIWDAPGMAAGAGKFVTVWDRHTGAVDNEHVIIDIAGTFFESGGNSSDNPSSNGGISSMTAAGAKAELAGGGFQQYHPVGL